jgi:hypothetical protein
LQAKKTTVLLGAVVMLLALTGCFTKQPSKCAQAREQLHQATLSVGKGDVGATASVKSQYLTSADAQISALQASYDMICENSDQMDPNVWDCEIRRHTSMLQQVTHARVQMSLCQDEACQKGISDQYRSSVQSLSAMQCN